MDRRRFTREFKVEAVKLVRERGVAVKQAARDLNIHENVLRKWVKGFASVLGAVATQTFRDASSKADLEKYLGRLAAFGRAHDLLTAEKWAEAPLQDVINTALAPYRQAKAGLRSRVHHLLSNLGRPWPCPWRSTSSPPTL
jgi:two-component sensor histidine kinase